MDLGDKAKARAIRLGRRLRAYRQAARLSQDDVHKLTKFSNVTIIRHEKGESVPTQRSLSTLLDLYRVQGPERDQTFALAASANEPGWLDRFTDDDSITDRYATFISWETDARKSFAFEALLVPGLLQTDDYARAVILATSPQVHPDAVDRLVEVRRRRRQALAKVEPLELAAVIDEAVLLRPVGGPAVMAAQLTALAKENRPHVTVQVLPFGAGAHPGMHGSFAILDLDELGGSSVVVIESAGNNVYLDEDEDVRRYVATFEALRSRAHTREDSAEVLAAAARKIKRQ